MKRTMAVLLAASVAIATTFGTPSVAVTVMPSEETSGFAFVNVNVVPMSTPEVLTHQTVVVMGERITSIGPIHQVDLPAGVIVIDGADRYLMPGLVDAHIHLASEYDLTLLLQYGVTTVRNMNGRPVHLRWRDEIARGQRPGPRIITAGPMLGDVPQHMQSRTDAASIAAEVARQAALGYDFIKVGDYLSATELALVMAAARQHDLAVVGHAPDCMRMPELLTYGMRSMEHLDGLAGLDEAELQELLPEMRARPLWLTPTLTIWQHYRPADGAQSEEQRALIDYVEHTGRVSCCLQGRALLEPHRLCRPSKSRVALVAALHEAHVPLLLGTDAPLLCMTPGESVHQELYNFVEAGLTPYEALRTATYNAADFLGETGEFGTVETGTRADLLLVRRNPLEDVTAARDIAGVMVNGAWQPSE